MKQFFGKYRAIVTNITDPNKSGRIQVRCPAVLGESSSAWAMPCVPFANDLGGMLFTPKVSDLVWVEFEGGDPNKPIWVGSFWKEGMNPVSTLTDRVIVLDEKGSLIKTTTDGDIIITAKRDVIITAERNAKIDAQRFDMP